MNVIAFLDADDLWLSRKLSLQVNYLLEHPELDFLFARMRVILEPGVERSRFIRREEQSTCYFPSAWMIRRAVFDTVGYFNGAYRTLDDWDWILRTRDAGIQAAVVPETLLERRIHFQHQREILHSRTP